MNLAELLVLLTPAFLKLFAFSGDMILEICYSCYRISEIKIYSHKTWHIEIGLK